MHHGTVSKRVNGAGVLERFTGISVFLIFLQIAQCERYETEILESATTSGLYAWSVFQ